MDFRDWKKVCEDNKTCTLQHPKGHKLTVMMRGLSSIHREQIKRLKMAEGGEVPADNSSGTPADSSQDPNGSHTSIIINAAPAAPSQAPAPQPAPMPSMAQAVNPAAQMAKAPLPVVPPQPVVGTSNLNENGQPNPGAISKNAQLIPEGQKNIDIAQSKAEVENTQQLNEGLGSAAQAYQDRYNNLAKHVDDFSQYMQKNPIDPKHYQENMGAGAKTASAIGLFFGGLGTPFGGHNFAADFLNKQIDRDIEAQKSRADQQKTIYGAYKDLYGEGKEALAATKATMIDIFNNKQKMIAAQLGTPVAFQKSLALSNNLAIEKQKALKEGAVPLAALPGFNSQKPSNAPSGGGKPAPKQKPRSSSGFEPPEKAAEKKAAAPDRILNPGSEKQLASLKYNPAFSEMMPQILEQHAKADLSDKALQTIDEVFPSISKETSEAGYARSHLQPALNSLPFVGGFLNHSSNAFTDTPTTRNYDVDKSLLKGAIRGALQGNVSDELMDSILDANSPEKGDEKRPELLAKKLHALKDFIKSHTRTDLLRQTGLSKK